MTINIYWACLEKEWQRATPPEPVLKRFLDNANSEGDVSTIKFCPAFRKELENLYGIGSLYDYEFELANNGIQTALYDQSFFDWHVLPRSLEDKFFSFSQEFIFFTDHPSLMMTGNLTPYMEDNNITERCIPVPGQFDIGKWFRPVEFSFFLKKDFNTFKINSGEIYQYVKFHTDEKINFVQFRYSEKLAEYMKGTMGVRENKKKFITSLEYFYNKFKLKKHILKEIKENIL
jgi:hypothetical protein